VELSEKKLTSVKDEVRDTLHSYYATLSDLPFIESHVRAVQGVTAADTLLCSAPCPSKPINTHHFAQGMRLRVGSLPQKLPMECTCGYYFGALPEPHSTTIHLMNCPDNHDKNSTTRHNRVVQAIMDVLSMYGIGSTMRGLKQLDVKGEKIPDLRIFMRKNVIIDLTIVDDVYGTKEHFDAAVKLKHDKYDSLAEQINMDFFAVPLSAYGAFGKETFSFINHVSKGIDIYKRSEFKRNLRCAMQHALLEGTSEVMDSTLQRLVGADKNFLL